MPWYYQRDLQKNSHGYSVCLEFSGSLVGQSSLSAAHSWLCHQQLSFSFDQRAAAGNNSLPNCTSAYSLPCSSSACFLSDHIVAPLKRWINVSKKPRLGYSRHRVDCLLGLACLPYQYDAWCSALNWSMLNLETILFVNVWPSFCR